MITRLGTKVGETDEMRLRSGHRVGVSGPAARIPTSAAEARAMLMKDGASTSEHVSSVSPSFGLARLAPPLPFALASTRPLLLAVLVFHRRRRRHGRPALTSRFLDPAPSPNAAVVMPPEHVQAFHEGLGGLLARWTALQLAITNEWGGADSSKKGDEMCEELLEWFLSAKGRQTRGGPRRAPHRDPRR